MENLIKQLNKIQQNLKAPKNQRNSYGNYNYRNAEDILEAYKKIAEDTILLLEDEMIQLGERYYLKATATLHLDKEKISVSALAREPQLQTGMNESIITGSASSYARKYAMNALFAIDDNKDADFTEDDKKRIELLEKYESEISMIDDLKELETYYHSNKDKNEIGKEFTNLITKRKLKLKKDETPQS